MSGPSDTLIDQQDQAEYLGILGLAPAETVKAFVADIASDLGHIDVISVQTGLLRFTEAASGDDSPAFAAEDVLVTEAHVVLAGLTDGYSAVFGSDTLHAVAVAMLDAALRADATTDDLRAAQHRIAHFIEGQAALLAGTYGQSDELALPQADTFPA